MPTTPQFSRIIKFLTRIRDSRHLWDTMGSLYNRRIGNAIEELYDFVAWEMKVSGQALMLDVGSGQGFISLLLAAQNPRAMVTGVDFSPMQVRKAEKLRQKRNIANCSFTRGNAMNLCFQDCLFDAAVSIGSIKHWPDGGCGLMEMHRILKPGARLLVAETDQEATDDAIYAFMERFKIWFIPDKLLFWGMRHVIFDQSYSQNTLAQAVRRAGFRDVECLNVTTCPYAIVRACK